MDKRNHQIDSLLYSGELSIFGNYREDGPNLMKAYVQFSGYLDRNVFIKLGEESREDMSKNMVNASNAFIEQLSLIKNKNSNKEVIIFN